MAFPLHEKLVKLLVQDTLSDIRQTRFGAQQIELQVTGQAIGTLFEPIFLHRLQQIQPNTWRSGSQKHEKDIVHLGTPSLSFEIKTSSSKNKIVGNRSSTKISDAKVKNRDGFILAVNYDICSLKPTLIRTGELSDEDWQGQVSQTGQCAVVKNLNKMNTIFKV